MSLRVCSDLQTQAWIKLSLPCLVFGHVFVQTYFPSISTLALEVKSLSLLLWIRIKNQAAENDSSLESYNVPRTRQLDVGQVIKKRRLPN